VYFPHGLAEEDPIACHREANMCRSTVDNANFQTVREAV
jgi:hypothetical protein